MTRCLDCLDLIAAGQRCRDCARASRRRNASARRNARQGGSGWAWQKRRRLVLQRDGGRCRACGKPASQVDHVVPLSRGGTSEPANLQALCVACHAAKSHAERHGRYDAARASRPSHPGLLP